MAGPSPIVRPIDNQPISVLQVWSDSSTDWTYKPTATLAASVEVIPTTAITAASAPPQIPQLPLAVKLLQPITGTIKGAVSHARPPHPIPATDYTKQEEVVYCNQPQSCPFEPEEHFKITYPGSMYPGPYPVIVVFHSGGCLWGSEDNKEMLALYEKARAEGYVMISVEYPKLQDDLPTQPTMEDMAESAKEALTFIYNHAEDYRIDSQQINVVGISAGTHVAYVALNELDPDVQIASFTSIYGFLSFDRAFAKDVLKPQLYPDESDQADLASLAAWQGPALFIKGVSDSMTGPQGDLAVYTSRTDSGYDTSLLILQAVREKPNKPDRHKRLFTPTDHGFLNNTDSLATLATTDALFQFIKDKTNPPTQETYLVATTP